MINSKAQPNIKIISLGKSYDIAKLEEILNLINSDSIKYINNIIIDAHELIDINVMGLEILELKRKMLNINRYSLVFAGLKPETSFILNTLDENNEYGSLVNFESIQDAVLFLNNINL